MRSDYPEFKEIAVLVRQKADGKTISFVSGNFNVVHPGHMRLLKFAAECGQYLVVGVSDNRAEDTFLDENLRLEAVQSIGAVDYAFILRGSVGQFIEILKPEVVVKGKEHENKVNQELSVIDAYGGKLLFSSGESIFSSIDLLRYELGEILPCTIKKPQDYAHRHGFFNADLVKVVNGFAKLKVMVIGDLIIDEYITCDPLGMSREDPTIVVTPIQSDLFVGGAGIVSAHARGLGADVRFFSVCNQDPAYDFARQKLSAFGVDAELLIDFSRPTTLKQRFRADGKTLLRVSHIRQHDIDKKLIERMFSGILSCLDGTDLVIFSDFNYGCLPQKLVDKVVQECAVRNIMMVADSQSSSQLSDISRFKGMRLITPTEHEARLAMREQGAGLVVLAESLRKHAQAKDVIITLGSEGLLIQSGRNGRHQLFTDRLPAFNVVPKDVAGAGDSLLTCASMALAAGLDIWQSAYLGSVASAIQVARLGNKPLSAADLKKELLS